ncbi:hypothetical protein [Methanobrevibacter sp.]|uniref:hypothetical protein n=1 Tax=Methanobrevibacter sp. TaxID=66852 RepID=UPI0038909418
MIKIKNSAPYGVFVDPRNPRKTMRGIYLAAFKAMHPNYDIVYQDINGKRDIGGDMMEVDLTPLEAFNELKEGHWFDFADTYFSLNPKLKVDLDIIETALNSLEILKKYLEPKLFQFRKPYLGITIGKHHASYEISKSEYFILKDGFIND